jgi:thiol:disulfide interchange protein
LILGFACYYGHLAWQVRPMAVAAVAAPGATGATGGSVNASPPETEGELLAALQQARATGRPLFVDFHASWCKDCSAMDATVFNRAEVKKSLQNFVAVRYAAEQPDAAPAKPLLDHFNIVGLPTYLVLSSK